MYWFSPAYMLNGSPEGGGSGREGGEGGGGRHLHYCTICIFNIGIVLYWFYWLTRGRRRRRRVRVCFNGRNPLLISTSHNVFSLPHTLPRIHHSVVHLNHSVHAVLRLLRRKTTSAGHLFRCWWWTTVHAVGPQQTLTRVQSLWRGF